MHHLYILCEGQTEEIVARDVIAPHYSATDIRITQSIFTTRRPAGGPAFKGGLSRFLPNLALHEIEAWVLADCGRLGEVMGDGDPAAELERIVRLESSPELVDDGVDTAPSKRIMNAYPQYAKTVDGPLVIADAGLDPIRRSCPHANDWLREIEARLQHQPTR